jgi:hypothetical protein
MRKATAGYRLISSPRKKKMIKIPCEWSSSSQMRIASAGYRLMRSQVSVFVLLY